MGRSWWSFILAWLWHWMFTIRDSATFQGKDCVDALCKLDTEHLAPFPTVQIGIGIILLSEENRCRFHEGYGTSGLSRCLWRHRSESWRNCSSGSTCTTQVASTDFKFLVGLWQCADGAWGYVVVLLELFWFFPTFPTFFGTRWFKLQRYLAYVDGTSFSDRLFWLLLTDSLVFKAGSSIRVWLDAGLQAWTHYVPVHGNLSETGMQCAKKKSEWRNLPRIEWSKWSNDKQTQFWRPLCSLWPPWPRSWNMSIFWLVSGAHLSLNPIWICHRST